MVNAATRRLSPKHLIMYQGRLQAGVPVMVATLGKVVAVLADVDWPANAGAVPVDQAAAMVIVPAETRS